MISSDLLDNVTLHYEKHKMILEAQKIARIQQYNIIILKGHMFREALGFRTLFCNFQLKCTTVHMKNNNSQAHNILF